MKWQQVSGTAEQKVPFEVICLIEAMQQASLFCIAYIVLGGNGWTLRDYYISGGLSTYIRPLENIRIVTLEAFIALANKGNL
jgi:hypothetical protein